MTARGCVSNVDHTVLTKRQLKLWGVKHHELLMNIKPHAHWFIDDKGIHVSEWKSRIPRVKELLQVLLMLFILDTSECLKNVRDTVRI